MRLEYFIEAKSDSGTFEHFEVFNELEGIEKIRQLLRLGYCDFSIWGNGFDIIEHNSEWESLSMELYD